MRHFLFSLMLLFAVAFPVFAQPVIVDEYNATRCSFDISNLTSIPNVLAFGADMPESVGGIHHNAGHIAVRIDGVWVVREAHIAIGVQRTSLSVLCQLVPGSYSTPVKTRHPDALAYPIDSLMTRSDIEYATIIRPNADNTAWTFLHAEEEEHYDRELAIQAAIVGAFQRTLDDANLDIIRHRKNASVQNAKILTYGRLIEFRDDWVGYALIAEQRKHIGHHVQDSTYVHECVIDSFNDAIKEWKKNKADAWTPIRYPVETVAKRRITTLYDYKEPWNHPTRQVIRNLKKKKAEAEAAAAEEGDGQ